MNTLLNEKIQNAISKIYNDLDKEFNIALIENGYVFETEEEKLSFLKANSTRVYEEFDGSNNIYVNGKLIFVYYDKPQIIHEEGIDIIAGYRGSPEPK